MSPSLTALEMLAFVLANNPTFSILEADLLTVEGLAELHLGEHSSQQEAVLTCLRQVQRLLFVIDDLEVAKKLLACGIHSATQIAGMPLAHFLEDYGTCFKSPTQAASAHHSACERKTQALFAYFNQKEQASPFVKASRFFQTNDSLGETQCVLVQRKKESS